MLKYLRRILSPDADPNAKEEDGWTPLGIAAQRGHTETVAALRAAGGR
ncbi:MAG: ankyrin repeat domain-containing protein [Rhodospirillales bacterium]|nr:ankyrin repeat domain-containing protein [Rhodospirillales bacterium]